MNCSNCNKFLIRSNKSGLCPSCYHKRRNTKRVENHLCTRCNKDVEPINCPHCQKIIGYKQKCNSCRLKESEEKKLSRNQEVK